MQRLTIEAATHLSAQNLYSVLSEFNPKFTVDDERGCFVSVDLGSDRQVVEVLNSVQRFVDARAEVAAMNSLLVAVDEKRYRLNADLNRADP
jgi:hypothetical protein